jgi:hypothetical protein
MEEKTAVEWLIEKFKDLEADFKYSVIDYETYKSKQINLLEQAKEMENYNAKIQARKYYLKGFEDAELTENQGCSHEQTMRDAETHFELVFEYQIKLK